MPKATIDTSIDLPLPLDIAWEVVTDTARVNLEAGNPAYQAEEELLPDGTLLRRVSGRMGPVRVDWEERFGQWVDRRWAQQDRHFTKGPLREGALVTTVTRLSADSTRVRITGEFSAGGLLGTVLARTGFLKKFIDDRVELIRRLGTDRAAAGTVLPALKPPVLRADVERRLAAALADLRQRHDDALVTRLEALLRTAAETDLARLRPLGLALRWEMPEAAVIALFLDAHRQGLLSLRWDLLCPRCRGGKSSVANLYELPRGVHCGACNIDFERDFTRNVELLFRPEGWLRPVAGGAFCMLGPVTAPHVKLQLRLEPGAQRETEAGLPPGSYRLRTLEAGAECDLDWNGEGGFPEVVIGEGIVSAGQPAPPGLIRIRNDGPAPRHAVIEDRTWETLALTGDRVLGMPVFRELCPEQVIRPGDEVSIGRTCVLFADLKGSTALYARMGDAAAYGLVRDYFAFFAERLSAAGGVLVKTMGDAVMATFADPQAAVATALAIHRDAGAFGRDHGGDALVSKIGIHAGPCVAVNTADRMDFFGRTVNLAARLQAQSDGSDIVLSLELAEDPAVAALIAGLPAVDQTVQLRGIPEPTALRKVQVSGRD
ncbi:MAG: adenylate/guanylate cyclase domain-containing protein [Sneathiellaceae bacterium]